MKCPSCGWPGAFVVVEAECSNFNCPNFTRDQLESRLRPEWLEIYYRFFPPTGLGDSSWDATETEWETIDFVLTGKTPEERSERPCTG